MRFVRNVVLEQEGMVRILQLPLFKEHMCINIYPNWLEWEGQNNRKSNLPTVARKNLGRWWGRQIAQVSLSLDQDSDPALSTDSAL